LFGSDVILAHDERSVSLSGVTGLVDLGQSTAGTYARQGSYEAFPQRVQATDRIHCPTLFRRLIGAAKEMSPDWPYRKEVLKKRDTRALAGWWTAPIGNSQVQPSEKRFDLTGRTNTERLK
jgi:hypothetical protein